MKVTLFWRCFAICLTLLALAACAGDGAVPPQSDPDPLPGNPDSQPGTLSGVTIRSSSGKPSGVRVLWDPLEGNLVGYHLYKLPTNATADIRGNTELMVEVDGSTTIPQPASLDDSIQVDDLFPAVVGDDWFYYLTTVDVDGDESLLSLPFVITIANFSIEGFSAPSAGVGDTFVIQGNNFGIFDPANDKVEVTGVLWVNGLGFQAAVIEAPIVSWTDTQVSAELPLGATSGIAHLTVGGVTQQTLDTLTNSDPYITNITPLKADITTDVRLIGANFGEVQDANHRVVFAGAELDPATYVQYDDTIIIFKAPNLHQFISHPLTCRVDSTDSNTGFLELVNAAPVAKLIASPPVAILPATISFDPAGTYDPEGTALTLQYDFEDDGVIDDTQTDLQIVNHLYQLAGTYTCRLTVSDADGAIGITTATVIVNEFFVTLTDAGSPLAGVYLQSQNEIVISYSITGGQPPYHIEWRQGKLGFPPELVATTDHELPGVYSLTWPIDTVNPRLPGERKFDAGSWRISARPADQLPANDPDGQFLWPLDGMGGTGEYTIHRYDVAVVLDAAGDPIGSETAAVMDALNTMGYHLTQYSSTGLLIDAVGPHQAMIWAADGPHGVATPYEWLEPADLTLMKQFVDRGSSLIILGPPAIDALGEAPFFDPAFNVSYQPFIATNAETGGNGDMIPQGYTAVNDFTIASAQYSGPWGNNLLLPFISGSSDQMSRTVTGNTYRVAGARPGPNGGNTYVGMFVYTNISGVAPAVSTPAMLLDNIVAGSIQRQ